jgi:hypothetical protein
MDVACLEPKQQLVSPWTFWRPAAWGRFMIRVTVRRVAVLGVLAIGTTSCTDNAVPAASPTGQSLFAPQFSGSWAGTAVLTSVNAVSDGECVQPTLQAQVGTAAGTDRINLTIAQESQSLAAHLSSASTGLSCSYQGTAAQNTLALDTASCDAPELIVRCTNGAVRELELLGSSLHGTVTGGQVSGTVANSYNVFDAVSGNGVTRVTLNYQLNAAKP